MQAGLLILLSVVVLLAYRSLRRLRGDHSAPWLAAAYLTNGIALAMLASEHPAHLRLTTIAGNALLLAFPGLASRALSEATGQRRGRVWIGLLALDVVTVAAFSYFTYVQPNWVVRSYASGILTAVMYGCLIWLVQRTREEMIGPAVRTMAWLFALHIVINAARMVVWRYTGTAVWFSGMNILTIGGVALSYLWADSLRAQERMERTAMTDPLTGLYNRRALDVIGVNEVRQAALAGRPSSGMMIDLDRFKDINDLQGHMAGDDALCALAGVLQSVCDIGMRLGGDEFFVLLPGADEEEVTAMAARIRLAVAELALLTPWGMTYRMSVSIGCATLRGPGTTVNDLMHASDILLYSEKHTRRDTACADMPPTIWSGTDRAEKITPPTQ